MFCFKCFEKSKDIFQSTLGTLFIMIAKWKPKFKCIEALSLFSIELCNIKLNNSKNEKSPLCFKALVMDFLVSILHEITQVSNFEGFQYMKIFIRMFHLYKRQLHKLRFFMGSIKCFALSSLSRVQIIRYLWH